MQNRGTLELIVGPMFAGKSEELMRRVRRELIANRKVAVFKPALDTRADHIVSHAGNEMHAITCTDAADVLSYIRSSYGLHMVAIDEVQFFDTDICEVVQECLKNGIRVVCAGLSVNFRGKLFNPLIGELFAMAETVDKLTAVCQCCGSPAVYNMRLINGVPAAYDADLIVVGGQESYEARCYKCFSCEKEELIAILIKHA